MNVSDAIRLKRAVRKFTSIRSSMKPSYNTPNPDFKKSVAILDARWRLSCYQCIINCDL